MFSPASMSACSLSAFLSNPAIGPSRLRAAGQIFPRDEPCEGATGQLMTPVCENALLHVIPHMIPVRFVRESDEALSPCKHRHPCNSFTATERIRKNARFFSLRGRRVHIGRPFPATLLAARCRKERTLFRLPGPKQHSVAAGRKPDLFARRRWIQMCRGRGEVVDGPGGGRWIGCFGWHSKS
jgi:hypothetical protein